MSISRKVLDSLGELGISLSAKPGYGIPDLPRDITELDDEGLMDLFVQFTQWNDHLSGAHALAVINEREAQRNVDVAEARAMMANNVERDSQVVSRELTRRTSDGGGMRSRQRKFTT